MVDIESHGGYTITSIVCTAHHVITACEVLSLLSFFFLPPLEKEKILLAEWEQREMRTETPIPRRL